MSRALGQTKLTPELQARYLAALRRSLYLETAASICDLDQKTVRNWMREGRKNPDSPLGDFSRAVKRVLAETEADRIEWIVLHGMESWQALAWVCERRAEQRWGSGKRELRELRKHLKELTELVLANAKPALPAEPEGRPAGGAADQPTIVE